MRTPSTVTATVSLASKALAQGWRAALRGRPEAVKPHDHLRLLHGGEEAGSGDPPGRGHVEGHLAGFVATGEIELLSIVDEIKAGRISKLIEENPALTSSELKKLLGDDFSYGQIKAVMNYKIYSASAKKNLTQ